MLYDSKVQYYEVINYANNSELQIRHVPTLVRKNLQQKGG